MTMHCPHCRRDNAATTRFCIACGAVLVESTPGGGRRRVLRPWGLRSSAPLTESPALPEMAAARRAAQHASPGSRARRLRVGFAGIAGVVALSGVIAYPYANQSESGVARPSEAVSKHATHVVAIHDLSAVRERDPTTRPLIEPLPEPVAAKPLPAAHPPARAVPRTAVPVSDPLASVTREPVGEPSVVEPPPAPVVPVPSAPVDAWQPLRDALAACSRAQGLWERATCEQRARLANCDGHWGAIALCPAGRTEFGQ